MPPGPPGRSPEELTTIVVTKFHPASLVRELAALGVHGRGGEPAPGGAGEGGRARRPRPHAGTSSGSCRARRRGRCARYAYGHPLGRPAVARGCAAPPTRRTRRLLRAAQPHRRSRHAAASPTATSSRSSSTSSRRPGLRLLGVMAVAPLDEEPARGVRAGPGRLRPRPARSRPTRPRSRPGCRRTTAKPSPKARHTFGLAPPLPGIGRSTVNLEEKSSKRVARRRRAGLHGGYRWPTR